MARPLLSPANSMEDAIFPFAAPTSNAIGDKPNIKLKVDIVGSFVDTCAPPKVKSGIREEIARAGRILIERPSIVIMVLRACSM